MLQPADEVPASYQSENFTLAPAAFAGSPQLDMNFLSSAKATVVLKCAIRMLDCVCGTFGNILMLIAIKRTTRLRTKSNMLIAALAVSDLIISGPQTIYFVTSQLLAYVFSNRPCDYRTMVAILTPFQKIPYCTSNSLLVGIAVDRYVAIVYPLQYETRLTERRVKMIIAGCYLLGILVGVAHALWLTEIDWLSCGLPYSLTLQFSIDFSIYIAVVTAFLVVYGRIFMIAIHHRKECEISVGYVREKRSTSNGTETPDHQVEPVVRKFKRREFKAARMTGIIICSFVLSWLPYHIGRGLQAANNKQQYTQNLLDVGSAMGSTNVALEWVYYGIMSRDFKQAFLKIFGYKRNLVADDWLQRTSN